MIVVARGTMTYLCNINMVICKILQCVGRGTGRILHVMASVCVGHDQSVAVCSGNTVPSDCTGRKTAVVPAGKTTITRFAECCFRACERSHTDKHCRNQKAGQKAFD